jgi:hypothetical protein
MQSKLPMHPTRDLGIRRKGAVSMKKPASNKKPATIAMDSGQLRGKHRITVKPPPAPFNRCRKSRRGESLARRALRYALARLSPRCSSAGLR